MPVYEYECLAHGHRFEVHQKISDNPLKSCQICNSPVQRRIFASPFHLKGGGWYAHGYSGGKAKDAAKSPTQAETKPSSVETKPKDTGEKPK